MGRLDELRAKRDELERRLVELARAVAVQHLRLAAQNGAQVETAELAASVEELLARLGSVNAKQAELRGLAAAT